MLNKITDKTIAWLNQHAILFHHRDGQVRLPQGQLLVAYNHVMFEPYIGIYSGNVICNMGSFSYSGSQLGLDWSIGRYCSLSWNITCPQPRHPTEFASTSNFTYDRSNALIQRTVKDFKPQFNVFREVAQKPGPVIGHDVWIGAGAVIMPGVTIGDGAIVAANSVVVKNVAPYEIVGGNPAQRIRFRFQPDVVEAMLELKWWEYRFTDFADLPVDNPLEFIPAMQDRKKQIEQFSPRRLSVSEIPF